MNDRLLEILKNHKVDLMAIAILNVTCNEYNKCLPKDLRLTKKEFDIIKEWLEK